MFIVIVLFVLLHISCLESHESYPSYPSKASNLYKQSNHKPVEYSVRPPPNNKQAGHVTGRFSRGRREC